MWSLVSETGAAPASPPEKTNSLSPMQAELVWYVLGLGGSPFVITLFQQGSLSGPKMYRIDCINFS